MLKVFILFFWLILTFSSCSKRLFTKSENNVSSDTTTVTSSELLPVNDSVIIVKDTSIIIPDSINTDSLAISSDTLGKDSVEVHVLEVSENAIEDPIAYKSVDSLLFDVKAQKVYLYNEAQVNYTTIELKANYIKLDLDSNQVFACGAPDSTGKMSGKPLFKDGGDEYKAKELLYNFESKKGLIKDVITEQSGGYLHSKRTKMHKDKTIHLKGGKYTTCDLEHPHFYIHLTKAKVIPNDKIVSGPAYLVIEDVPIYLPSLPFGFFPNNDKKKSGILIPEYGQEQNRGFFLRNGGYYFSFSKYMDLQLRGDIYANGSWGVLADTRYKVRYKFNGSLSAKYSNMILDDSGVQTSYWLRWKHQQDSKARPNSRFSANVDFGSSNYNFINSQSLNRRLESETSSSISYNKNFANTPFAMSANFRHTQNNLDSTVSLSLPDVAFTMSRITPLKRRNKVGKTRWYEKIGVSMTSNFKNTIRTHEDTLFREEALNKFQNGVMHKVPVSTSMKLLKFININPSFSYTERWYWKSVEKTFERFDTTTNRNIINTQLNPGFKRAGDYLVSVPFSTKLYGFFINKNTDSYFQALRHVMTPTVSYSYRPEYSLDKFGYYKYVTNDVNDTLEMYSIFNGGNTWTGIYGAPPSGKYGSINFNLGNNLEMKVKSKNDTTEKKRPPIKLLDNLSLSTSYNMAADSIKWSYINLQARTTIKIFNINVSAIYDPYYWNSLGNSVDHFIINKNENALEGVKGVAFNFARLRSANISVGFAFNSNTMDKKKEKETDAKIEAARLAGLPGNYWEHYVDFNIPWNLRINYNYNYSQYLYHEELRSFEYRTTQTVNFSGDLNLTSKWKIAFSSGWDFEMKALTSNTNVSIYRDLHCWEASFQWVPMGTFRSYSFSINVKASVLKDLKLNRKRSWADNF